MRVTQDETIAGFPALEMRTICRAIRHKQDGISVCELARMVQRSPVTLRQRTTALLAGGYLQPHARVPKRLVTTMLGNQLAMASTFKPMTRERTKALLHEVLERVRAVNANKSLAFYVCGVFTFGSYARGAQLCSDLDLLIYLDARPCRNWDRLFEARRALAPRRQKKSYLWPESEVLRIIKNRNPRISLHHKDDPVFNLPNCWTRHVFRQTLSWKPFPTNKKKRR